MSRQDANAIFAHTSFLYGGNAAYIEDLYAKYEADPAAVDAEWRSFFQSLKDEKSDVIKSARGASWKTPNWPVRPSGDLVASSGFSTTHHARLMTSDFSSFRLLEKRART